MSKTRTQPQISVNKLAEYLEANATRRRQIVLDAKYPEKFIVTRYKDAREIIKQYLTNGFDEDIVLDAISGFEAIEPKNDFQEQDRDLSIASLEALLESDLSFLHGFEIKEHNDEKHLVKIKGVNISVNPDLIVLSENDGIVQKGAIKIHISKSNSLTDESQIIVALLVHNYMESYGIKKGEAVALKQCISFDVFKENAISAPTAIKLRLKRIATACEEIALWWDSL